MLRNVNPIIYKRECLKVDQHTNCYYSFYTLHTKVSWSLQEYPGVSRGILEYPGVSWSILEYSGVSCSIRSILEYPRVPWSIPEYPGVSWSILEYPRVSWSILEYHGVSWSILEYPEVSWSILEHPIVSGVSWSIPSIHIFCSYHKLISFLLPRERRKLLDPGLGVRYKGWIIYKTLYFSITSK